MARWNRQVKHALGLATFGTGAHRYMLRDQALIVVFHRVDDALNGNPISCTSKQFRKFCRFFRSHFDVVSLQELLDHLEAGRDVGGKLVITFDDGYEDNHRVAAPILEEVGLPACFFVATGFIESSAVPWWDEERGITPTWMTWSQVRDLSRRGFEIGAHTVTHPDLGKLEGPEAISEISESRHRLEQELGREVSFFSYPFGRRDQMAESNREVLKALNFRCCVSAFGGLVTQEADPFELPRLPVSPWHLSPPQLGWEAIYEG